MGFMEAFVSELDKIAAGAPAVTGSGVVKKIIDWIKKNPGKSGLAGEWLARGMLSGGDKE